MTRAHALAGSLAALLAAPFLSAAARPAPVQLPLDDLKGRWVLYEPGPIQPIDFSQGSPRFFTLNQPGSRLVEFALGSPTKLTESPTGPGLVSIAVRKGTIELWGVDRVTNSVTVFDRGDGHILRSIRVGAEPHGIVFSESRDRAYVTCSAVDRVDVIDTATYQVVNSIPIPARNPRGIARIGDRVYVASFLSGNGTAPLGNTDTGWPDDVTEVRYPSDFPGTQPLPDRDLFVIPVGPSPATDALDPAGTVTGLGTILYNLEARPGTSELWVPNTEALNAIHRGEQSFVEGQVVANRIAIVDASGATPSVSSIVDLDALAPAPELRCAAPTDVAFTSDGSTAFVCGYGSDSVAVLDASVSPPAWLGLIHIPRGGGYPDGAGSRCLAVDPTDQWLIVYNKGENSVTQLELAQLPTTPAFEVDAPLPETLGWDPTPSDMRQGRVHFIRNANSKSNTSSCQSCHVDGHIDGVAWDLGRFLDPEGTPNDALAFPLDPKGPMVTQSVRHLREVGPYHWRGEKNGLVSFNSTFVDLLEREENGVPKNLGPNFRYITQYMEHLAIPANPRQEPDRSLTAEQQAGLDIYMNEPVLGALACVDCHPLPLGTAGEVVDNLGGGFAPATVVPSLRGVVDKGSAPFVVGGPFGTRTELGVGYGHGGALATIQDVLLQQLPPPQTGQRFDVTPAEADQLTTFLQAFDTGLAPATTWQVTATPQNAGTFRSEQLEFLLEQADAGHCDLVYRYGPGDFHGEQVWFTGLYDPGTSRFRQASASLPPLLVNELIAKAASGTPVTFLGVPRLSGWPMGVDRDNDKLLDLDELLRGTDPEFEDTDEDGYHDGYEVQWAMDPLTENTSSPDNAPPQLLGPVRIQYTTTSSIKFEFEVDEQARILFSYNGGGPVLRAPLKPRHDDEFSEVLGDLQPNTYYQVRMDMEDLDGNTSTVYFDAYTSSRVSPAPARLESHELKLIGSASGAAALQAELFLGFGDSVPAPAYDLTVKAYYRSDDGTVLRGLGEWTLTTDVTGRAGRRVALPKDLPQGQGELYFVVLGAEGPAGSPVYAVAEGLPGVETIEY